MKKILLIALCLAAALLLNACSLHIDSDPWPASPDYSAPAVTPETTNSFTHTVQQLFSPSTPTPEPDRVAPGLNG